MLETFKQRDYSIEDYRFNVQTASTEFTFDGENANDLLADENIWVPASGGYQDSGVFVQGQRLASNTYDATQNIAALYGMTELAFSGRLKTIVGLRYEHAFNTYTGEDQNRNRFNNETVLNKGVILPSLNFVYKINSESKIRTSVTRTVARPSFKELSNAQIVDRISGRTFLGNINLEQTDITNFDFRFERFMRKNQRLDGQSYAISGFYKHFTNPIELVAFDDAAPNDFQPQNVGNATVYGIELEMKENIKFMTKDTVYETNFGANVTLVKSQVEMTPGEVQGRIESARMGEDIQIFRDMVGQSPYIVNAFFNFIHEKTNSEFALSYNVQGQRLSIVGVGRNPDVYEMPFHSLNLKASTLLGKENKWKASVTARNLLNSERYLEYQSYGAENQLFSRLRPQQSFSVSIGYTL
jgi:outer membrane receptor protein involved in Fe transport